MKFKKQLAALCVVGIVSIMGTTAFAASETESRAPWAKAMAAELTDEQKADWEAKMGDRPELTEEQKAQWKEKMADRPQLTDEQKAEMETKKAEKKASMDAMNEKWAALTDAQKEEIYALKDKSSDIDSQIIDKYVEYGLIDETTAVDMKAKLTERKTDMRESGKMPGFGKMRGGHGSKNMKDATTDATTSAL